MPNTPSDDTIKAMKLSASLYFIVLSLAVATLIAFQGKSDWKDI